MATSEILNFSEASIIDEEMERYEFHEYEPVARSKIYLFNLRKHT